MRIMGIRDVNPLAPCPAAAPPWPIAYAIFVKIKPPYLIFEIGYSCFDYRFNRLATYQ
jgi:hypothetical protein